MSIVSQIGESSNVTISAPLVKAVEQIGLLRVFLSSSMTTIVFFLAILSI